MDDHTWKDDPFHDDWRNDTLFKQPQTAPEPLVSSYVILGGGYRVQTCYICGKSKTSKYLLYPARPQYKNLEEKPEVQVPVCEGCLSLTKIPGP